MQTIRNETSNMKKNKFVVSCGGIRPDPLEPPMEEMFVDPAMQGMKTGDSDVVSVPSSINP